jgi:carboxypeptidase Q
LVIIRDEFSLAIAFTTEVLRMGLRVVVSSLLMMGTLLFCSATRAQVVTAAPNDPLHRVQGAGACTTDATSACAEAAGKILPLAMGPSPMQENLRRLTDEVGGRVTGSPQMARAVAWATDAFRAAGVPVHTEKYELAVSWSEGDTRVEMLSEPKFPLRAVSIGWSPATPAGGFEAPVVDMDHGTEKDFAAAGGAIKGAILLAHTDIGSTWADLFAEYSQPLGVIERAKSGGALAILWISARERLLLYRHTNSGAELEKIPQAILAREDGMRLSRTVLAYPGKVRVRFSMPNKIGGPVEQENVVGEITGYEKPDEAVILGAHLDSWDLGTGALDNGCNAAMVIEAARVLKATGLRPRRTIRFVLFSGEEQGELGSRAYVRAHRAELDKIRAAVIFDSGIGKVTGYSLGGRPELEAGLREVLKPLESWDINHHSVAPESGSDHLDFMLEGVPALIAEQDEANYMPNYHAASDTLDKVDIRTLKEHTVIAALTAWGIADRVEPLGKRLTRAEIEANFKETGFDQAMKAGGEWEEWASGKRGRQP